MPRLALQLLGCGARFAVASLASLLAVSAPVAISARAPETGARYSDEDPGFAVQAPPGWRLLRQGELELPKGARVGFLGPRGGAYVYVVAESIGGGIIHRNESALAVYLRSLMSPTLYESVRTKPVPAALGGRPALRASMSVTTGQGSLVKTITASREGYWYFAIVSIATPGEAERHMTAHHAFERGVAISKTSDEVVDGIARRIGGFVPFLSAGERRSLLYSLIDRSASPSDGADLVEFVASIAKFGSALIPAADRESLDSLESKARSSPPGQEAERLLRLREYRPGRRAFLREDEARLDASMGQAYAVLTPAELVTLRRVYLECIRLGLDAYDHPLPLSSTDASGFIHDVPSGVPGGIPGGVPGGIPTAAPGTASPDEVQTRPPPERPRVQRVSGAVLDEKATRRPLPPFPNLASDAGIEGFVIVEVTVSEAGAVQSARAVSGHPLLRDAAVQTARGWAFRPVTLGGQPIKVVGIIGFTFRKPPPPPPEGSPSRGSAHL